MFPSWTAGPASGPTATRAMGWPRHDAEHRLVSAEAMQALEERLFASGLPVAALMEKAALAVSQRLLKDHGERLRCSGALVLVGPGHNGGDGLVVARELQLAGIRTSLWSPFERHKPLTESHLRHALWLGIPRLEAEPEAAGEAFWIDALLGSGQRRRPGEAIETLLQQRQQQRPDQLLAVDVPTGLCADTGRLTGGFAATALCTHAIGLIKQGLLQDSALAWVGELVRIELGITPAQLAALPGPPLRSLWPPDRAKAPWPALPVAAHKYGRGRLLLAVGSRRYPGAAALAVAGASASGCGCVRAALPAALAANLWQQAPHLLIDPPLAAAADGSSRLGGLAGGGGGHNNRDERLDALLVGPGLGPEPAQPDEDDAATWRWLKTFPGLLVLDADGLNRLASRQATAWLQARQGPTWLTPHRREFARLFPDLAQVPALEAAAIAAERSQAAVLLKGARSIVAAPDGRIWQLGSADARSARTGLGDVLAGYAAGCGARSLAALRAQCLGPPPGSADAPDRSQPASEDPGLIGLAAAGLDRSLAPLLAAAALEHACAGLKASQRRGQAVTPMDVAAALADGEL